ncbi:MAG: LiaF domain-containing protein [archaeon]
MGVTVFVIGIIFLGNFFEFWQLDLFFDGWWTIFIIIPSINGLIKKQNFIMSIIGLSLGVFLLLLNQGLLTQNYLALFVAITLLVIGIHMIYTSLNVNKALDPKNSEKEDRFSTVSLFGGGDEKYPKSNLDSASITKIFGGGEIDFSNATINKDIVINVGVIFGGVDLILPDNVNIISKVVPVFGGVDVNSENYSDDNKNNIYVTGLCLFAGVDIYKASDLEDKPRGKKNNSEKS